MRDQTVCGIFGCAVRSGRAAKLIHGALKRLEYRGYDSVGEATVSGGAVHVRKAAGKIEEVHEKVDLDGLLGKVGIGHTRWATHGAPTETNAHPHLDCTGKVAVVHNGIIENHELLKKELKSRGHHYRSGTDSEVVAHLIEEHLNGGCGLAEAIRQTILGLEGSYALAVISSTEPDKVVCARHESPLVLGIGEKGMYCASDIPAFLPMTNRVIYLKDDEMAILTAEEYQIMRVDTGSSVERSPEAVDWTVEMAEKQGYPHFTLKEIHEQPECLRNTLRLRENYLDLMTTFLDRIDRVYAVGCGTSYHACLTASYLFSKIAFKSVQPVVASEFAERFDGGNGGRDLVLAVSQSGETADTLAAVNFAREHATTVIALSNVMGSSLCRVSWAYVGQQSGPEIGVAATKTFTSQVSVLTQLALRLAVRRGKASQEEMDLLHAGLHEIPEIVDKTICTQEENIRRIAKKYGRARFFLFLGRGLSSAVASEGALKMMELSQVPSIAFPAGEIKHGPLSLVENGVPAVFVCPRDETRQALLGDIEKIKARGGSVIAVAEEDDEEVRRLADDFIGIPKGCHELLTPIPFVVPLQLLAYHLTVERGLDPDHPRNLAKSVTVR